MTDIFLFMDDWYFQRDINEYFFFVLSVRMYLIDSRFQNIREFLLLNLNFKTLSNNLM